MRERLQKLLSQRGIASRRQAEKMILAGRVTVNGEIAELGQSADVGCDRVCVDDVEIGQPPTHIYILLNKPRGVVSTCHDPQKRKTVIDLLNAELQRGMGIHPVGRLDADSTGALLLTNDGNLTHQLTHPSHQMAKVYRVWVKGIPSKQAIRQWRAGIVLDERKTLPADVTLIRSTKRSAEMQQSLLEITLTEGRNRQIRRIAEGLGHPVTALHRAKIGSLELGKLSPGRYRLLENTEIAQLQSK